MTLPEAEAKAFMHEISRVGAATVNALLADMKVRVIAELTPQQQQDLMARLKELPDG